MKLSPIAKVAVLAVFVAVAFGLRSDGLSAPGLSEDEVNKLVAARGYLAGDLTQNREHPMMMKLQIAVCLAASDAWNARFGGVVRVPDEVPVRLPNVLFGALTTIVLFAFVEQFFGTATGLLTAALWATGISAIAINRIAKEDTLVVFFFWSCLYFYERAKRYGTTLGPGRDRSYALAGAALGLMLASKYFPHLWAFLFLFYHFVGRNPANQPLSRRDYAWFYGAFAACFLVFNPTVLLPSTLQYFVAYTDEQTLTHHGYVLMGQIYPNNASATPGGLPIYYYPLLLAVKTPVAVLAAFLVGLFVSVRRRSETGSFFLVFMFVLWIVPYSIFAAKFYRYVLTLMPIVYTCAAVGVVETVRFVSRRLAGPSFRFAAAAVLVAAVVAFPVRSALAVEPYPSLYLNALGGGRIGYFFPHDEFYDLGLREAIARVCSEAPPNAVVYGEAPPVFQYYQNRFGRPDLRFHALSEIDRGPSVEPPEYVIVQDGRVFFENERLVRALEATRTPEATIVMGGGVAARVYRMQGVPLAGVVR